MGEPWQQLNTDGYLYCKLCHKYLDDKHEKSRDHQRRFRNWKEAQVCSLVGYAAPPQEHLAYVPFSGRDDDRKRSLKCLLCQKWCQDDVSHAGTHANPAVGSKDHQKNLRNYAPGHPWWELNVSQERRR